MIAMLIVSQATGSTASDEREITRILGHDPQANTPRSIAHLALRLVLAREIGRAAALKPFSKSPLGKPSLDGSAPAFSLSHSGKRALIAISRDGAVGCDIEAPRVPRLPAGKRDMIIAAAADIAGEPVPASPPEHAFLQAWVRLEAVAKATGEGMGRILTRYGIFGTDEDRARLSASEDRLQAKAFNVRDLDLDQGYAAAVAVPVGTVPIDVQMFPNDGFANFR